VAWSYQVAVIIGSGIAIFVGNHYGAHSGYHFSISVFTEVELANKTKNKLRRGIQWFLRWD
jgi:hypothetical protein